METGTDSVSVNKQRFSIEKLGAARVYIVEYILSLWMLAGVLTGVCVLFGSLVDHFASGGKTGLFSGFSLTITLTTVTALIVALPAYSVFFIRTNAAAKQTPSVMTTKWYMFVRNLFFVIIALATLSAFTTIIYTALSHIVAMSLEESPNFPWATYLKSGFTTLFLWYAGYFYYRRIKREGK